jgi:hypothetical protein
MRIKGLSLSQSKQEKEDRRSYYHTERQRLLEPETTNIRVIDPTTHPYRPPHACPLPCTLPPPPTPPLQRTTAAHTPFAVHPPPFPPATPSPLHRTCCPMSPAPSSPLRARAPPLPINPPPAPSTPISLKAKHTPDKSPLPNCKQLHFPLPRP